MLRTVEPQGDYITRRAAAYPVELNRALAAALAKPVKASARTVAQPNIPVRNFSFDPKPTMALKNGKSGIVDTQVDDRFSLRNVTTTWGP